MGITSSSFAEEGSQIDGRRWVRERHTLTGGETVEFYYLCAADADPSVVMADRAAALTAEEAP